MKYALEKWQHMSKDYEVRIKLDGTGVIQRKLPKSKAAISIFDVPQSYIAKLLHADAEVPQDVADEMIWAVRQSGDQGTANDMSQFMRQQNWEDETVSFRQLFTSLTFDCPLRHDPEVQNNFIEALEELGYVGLEYVGGITMGGGYKHRAFVFWDQKRINRYRIK